MVVDIFQFPEEKSRCGYISQLKSGKSHFSMPLCEAAPRQRSGMGKTICYKFQKFTWCMLVTKPGHGIYLKLRYPPHAAVAKRN